jgi:Protein of unknown function (DUF4127)
MERKIFSEIESKITKKIKTAFSNKILKAFRVTAALSLGISAIDGGKISNHTDAPAIKVESNLSELQKPTPQDKFALRSGFTQEQIDSLDVSVLSPRSQTEKNVLEVKAILGKEFTDKYPVIIPERLIQNPKIVESLKNPEVITLAASFQGIGKIDSIESYTKDGWTKKQHMLQLQRIVESVKLLRKKFPEVKIKVVSGLGDSVDDYGLKALDMLNNSLIKLSNDFKFEFSPGGFGADELAIVSQASVLPISTINLSITNPESTNYYDSGISTETLVREKLKQIGLVESENPEILALVLSGGDIENIYKEIEVFAFKVQNLKLQGIKDIENKVAIIDTINPNGSSIENEKVLKILNKFNLDISKISFTSWGTANNSIGETLARKKIQQYALKNRLVTQEKLIEINIENFAHDFIFRNAKSKELFEKFLLNKHNTKVNTSKPDFNYKSMNRNSKVLLEIAWNSFINLEIKKYFPNSKELTFHYQSPRNFEAFISTVQNQTIKPTIPVAKAPSVSFQEMKNKYFPEIPIDKLAVITEKVDIDPNNPTDVKIAINDLKDKLQILNPDGTLVKKDGIKRLNKLIGGYPFRR